IRDDLVTGVQTCALPIFGDGTTTDRNTPVTVSGLTDAVALGGGYEFTCALEYGGTVQCWGDNTYGQLGDGTNTPSTTPVAVSGEIGRASCRGRVCRAAGG